MVTRYMSFVNAGIGRISQELVAGLFKKGHSIKWVSTEKTSLASYFKYTMLEVPKRIPKDVDVYHAVTPMEGIWIPKKKSVVQFQDLIPLTNPNLAGAGIGYSKVKLWLGKEYFRWASKVASRAHTIIAISEETKSDVVDCLGVRPEKVRVLRLGIREDLDPRPKRTEKFTVGYLGQLDKRKRVNLLIEAVKRTEMDLDCLIGGFGVDGDKLKALADGDPRIRFLGFIPDNDLVNFYNSLDVLVFPTAIEGYGLPIVEAMACKKPVVVLEDAIIPWEVKKRCIILDELDLGALPVFGHLKDTPYLEGNYQFAKAHTWDGYVDGCLKLYEEVLG